MTTTGEPISSTPGEALFASAAEALKSLKAAASSSPPSMEPLPQKLLTRVVGPRPTAALGLLGRAQGTICSTTYAKASSKGLRPEIAAMADPYEASADELLCLSPLLLPIPPDHTVNRRTDSFDDFAALHAKGLIRGRDGEVIEIKSIWHAFGAYRMDRFFQAYCQRANAAAARAEPFPSDSVKKWVTEHATSIGMPMTKALSIIRDGCGGNDAPNSLWWRGASLPPSA